jgi:hypothetical protein
MAFPINPNPGDTYTDAYGTVWVYAGSVNGWYRQTVIPGNETTYTGGGGGNASATGNAGEIQYTDGTNLAASPDLLWDDVNKELEVGGDIQLDDGGTFTTTIQTVTATANRTISYPDATGTVALVAGSSGQLLYNASGANAGASTLTYDGSILTTSGRFINSYNATASSPAKAFTGTWFTGGTSTTTKPQVVIEPTGTTSTSWSTSGTGLGVNAASGFAGNLLDLQVNGTSRLRVDSTLGGQLVTNSSNLYSDFRGGSNINTGIKLTSGGGRLTWNASTYLSWFEGSVGVANLGFGPAGENINISRDVVLERDAANSLAQRRTTNAQTFRVYNTYTSDTNFERAKLQWDTNVLKVGTEKGADGGTARDMELQTDGTTRITLKANGAILFAGLPTSDPAVAGQLWNDGNTLKISAG